MSGSIRFKKLILKGDYQTAMDVAKNQVRSFLEARTECIMTPFQSWYAVSSRYLLGAVDVNNYLCGLLYGTFCFRVEMLNGQKMVYGLLAFHDGDAWPLG